MPLDSIAVFSVLDRVTNSDGTPVASGTVEFYLAGTSTALTVYSDYGLTQSLGTTVSLNSAGYPVSGGGSVVSVYTGTSAYKIIVKDADGVTISDLSRDNIKGAPEIPATNETALPEVPVVVKTAAYTSVDADQGKLIVLNCTGGSFLATLPSAVTVGDGWSVGFLMGGTANTTGFKTTGGETITIRGKDLTSVPMATKGEVIWVTSDGANWRAQSVSSGAVAGLNTIIVTDRLTAPPTSPAGGAAYIINGTPTGAWATLGLAEDQIAIADGNGSWTGYTPSAGWRAWIVDEEFETIFNGTEWVDQTNTTAPSASALKIAIWSDEKATNTSGGTSTDDAWTTHTLQTERTNTITGASLSGSQFTLPTGKYRIDCQMSAYAMSETQIRLYSVTNASVKGASVQVYTANYTSGSGPASILSGAPIVLTAYVDVTAASETFALQYYTTVGGVASSLGRVRNIGSENEVYALVTVLDLASIQGPQGEQGTQGVDGLDAAYPYQWSTATSGDPGSGKVRGNNATIASITEIGISETDSAGGTMGGVIDTWDSGTSSVKARIKISKEGATQNFHYFYITGAGTDQGSYWTFPVSYVATSGTISNGNDCALLVIEKGDKGDTGAAGVTGSTTFTFSTTTTDNDPGSGVLRLNNATAASATAAYIDNNNSGGSDISAWLDSFDDTGESAFRGHLHLYDSSSPTTVFRIYKVTGSVTDGTGYRKIVLEHVTGAGTYTNGNTVIAAWLPRGATGVGDTTGAASSTDNAIVRFDGTGGKTLQNSAVTVDDSGNLASGLGTVSAPAYSFTGDSNTGVYSPGANLWAVATNGSKRLHIAATGEVTIGDETSPNAAFNVITSPSYGGSDWTAWFRHEGSAANNESLIRHEHFSNTEVPLPIITGIANRGTIASRSAVQSGDYLFVLDGRGYDGSGTSWTEYANGVSDTAAQIAFRAAENWSGTAHGAKITFSTVATTETTATERWAINASGGITSTSVTGGDKGAGTINAANLYVSNVAVLTVNNLSTATAGQLGYYSGTHTVAGSGNFTVSGSTLTIGQAGTALGGLALAGNTSGTTTLNPAAAASGTLTLPAATDTLVGRATTDTLTNKTLTSPLGSASAPTFSFGGDTNTGMYSPGADTIAWAVGGAQHMTLAASTLTLPGSSTASTVISATSASTTASHRGDVQFYRNNNGSALSNGWWVGTFNFFGYDGASNLGAANFACIVDGTVSSGVMPLKIQFQTGTNSSPSTTLTLTSAGSVVCGNAAIATNATDGFLYIPSCAGTPSGTPTTQTGRCAFVYDTTNNKLYVYNGAWKATAALT